MKVLYDHQIFSVQKYGGISRYFSELIFNMDNIEVENSTVFTNNYYLKSNNTNKYKSFFPNKNFKGKLRLNTLINRSFSTQKIKKSDFDIFHPTYFDPYFLKRLKTKPFVLTVHDMIPEKYSTNAKEDILIKNKKELILRADKVIAISNQTKNDILEYTDVDANKIEVIYHGYNLSLGISSPTIHIPDFYILFVGERRGYKNFDHLAKAFALLNTKMPELKLICVGNPFIKPEKQLLKTLCIDEVTSVVSVNDTNLASLYKNAELFVFPSLYEGFGMPILEAMALGCPVVLSNSSCFPEIASDAAEYFDPNDEISITTTIEKILSSTTRKKELTDKGLKRVKEFSWKETALQTSQLYKKLIG